jgi:HSP20 family molecular chaperone IbpA
MPVKTQMSNVRQSIEGYWRGEIGFGPTPAVDIIELDDLYRLTAELPGVIEQNVDVTFSDDTLTLNVQKEEEQEDEGHDHFLSERRYGTFQRSFRVPNGVDADQVTAGPKNGVLIVILPKTWREGATRRSLSRVHEYLLDTVLPQQAMLGSLSR